MSMHEPIFDFRPKGSMCGKFKDIQIRETRDSGKYRLIKFGSILLLDGSFMKTEKKNSKRSEFLK